MLECHWCWVSGKSATGQSDFASVSPVQAPSVCFMRLSCRVKSFTDTHSYSLLVGPRNNKPEVLQSHMSPRTKPIENRRTEGTENKCELNKQISVNISPIKTIKTCAAASSGVQ